jgi:hypothetical protein
VLGDLRWQRLAACGPLEQGNIVAPAKAPEVQLGHMRWPGPGGPELGAVRDDEQHRKLGHAPHHKIEQLDGGRVGPMCVLQQREHRPTGRQRLHPPQQRGERTLPSLLRAQPGVDAAALGRYPEQVGDEIGLLLARIACCEQGPELGSSQLRPVPRREAGGPLEPGDDGMQRAVCVLVRAVPDHFLVVVGRQRLLQGNEEAGLADPGLTRDQHHLALTGRRPAPAPQQKLEFLLPPDRRRTQVGGAQSREATLDGALAEGTPRPHGA